MNENLERVKLELLKGKKWRYLRYQHARQALEVMSDWEDVLVVGAGNGLAEIALALEFRDKFFYLTEQEDTTHSFKHAKAFVEAFRMKNVAFGSLDILQPGSRKFDVVYSVEVLEHIKDDALAASNMKQIARRYIFCLVPFAQDALNSDEKKRKSVYEKHKHFVVGYDVKKLVNLFPDPITIQGCYWQDAGLVFRSKLSAMEIDSIVETHEELMYEASKDIKNRIQTKQEDALGIWTVSEVGPV